MSTSSKSKSTSSIISTSSSSKASSSKKSIVSSKGKSTSSSSVNGSSSTSKKSTVTLEMSSGRPKSTATTPSESSSDGMMFPIRTRRIKNQVYKEETIDYCGDLNHAQRNVLNMIVKEDVRSLLVYYGIGSGKTRLAIAAAELLIENKIVNKAVVLTPATLRENFKKEMSRFDISQIDFKVDSHESILGKNSKLNLEGKILIVDEAHQFRNFDSQKTQRLILLAARATKIILLTGTPIVHEPVDLMALSYLMFNESENHLRLPPMKPKEELPIEIAKHEMDLKGWTFDSPEASKLLDAIYRDRDNLKDDAKREQRALKQTRLPWFERIRIDKDKKENTLKRRFDQLVTPAIVSKAFAKRVLFYRDKSILPRKNITEIGVNMPSDMARAYFDIKKTDQGDGNPFETGEADEKPDSFLVHSRQASNTITVNGVVFTPKVDVLIGNVQRELSSNNKAKVIIYSFFLDNGIALIKEHLEDMDFDMSLVEMVTGDSTQAHIRRAVERYNKGHARIMLLSSAGSEGLDLKETSSIHILDTTWSKAQLKQIIGRGIRRGSHKDLSQVVPVNLYVLLPPTTPKKEFKHLVSIGILSPLKADKLKGTYQRRYDKYKDRATADEELYAIQERKSTINKPFTRAMKRLTTSKTMQTFLSKLERPDSLKC